jgi:hypothetical protein
MNLEIRTKRQQWMDDIPLSDPVPALEHVYTFMLMELGPPKMSWLLSVGPDSQKITKIRDAFALSYTTKQLILQFDCWYHRQQKPNP